MQWANNEMKLNEMIIIMGECYPVRTSRSETVIRTENKVYVGPPPTNSW